MAERIFEGRTALVTGGARGIGAAIVRVLAEAGARVAINYQKNEKAALDTLSSIAPTAAPAMIVRGDVSVPEDVNRMVGQVRERFGPIDLLVNNAGVAETVPHTAITFATWKRMMAVNLDGPFLTTWAVKDEMIARRFGRIVNVSSLAGVIMKKNMIHYATAKAAVISFTRHCAEAFAPHNVRVNCVAPGLTNTDIAQGSDPALLQQLIDVTPLGRMAEPEEIATVVRFLLSEDSSFVTGQTIVACGGAGVMVDLMREYAARRPKSVELYRRACKVLAGGVGHDLRHFAPMPVYTARAKGARKWDVDGNEYIDFLMGNGALLLGHADAEVCAAVTEAMASGSHFGNDHPLHIAWAEMVQKMVPSAERVRFVNSGTEASALALRLARAHTDKPKILRFEGHFHGWHDDVVHGFQPPFDADGSLGVPPEVREQLVTIPDNDLDRLTEVLAKDKGIAAAILEASGASWGRVPLAPGFMKGLRKLTQKHGVVLIFDEVVTGFRWSPGGAQELEGVVPDLTCLAKILAGGMPGGAVVGRADIMKLFDQTGDVRHDRFGRVVHLGTFNANPPSAAAGMTVLRRVAGGQPIAQANRMAELLRQSWDGVLERLGVAGYVYGPASTFHVYFETDPKHLAAARKRGDLHTNDAKRLKGMPGALVTQYQRLVRFHGLDIMSSTGGVLSASHTEGDIAQATAAFEKTVVGLLEEGLIHRL